MHRSKVILKLFYTVILGLSVVLTLKAQSAFPEGILIYKADTIKRLEASPASYIVSQVVVHKKLDQLRVEVWRIDKFNKIVISKDIHIRNEKGTYVFIESSNPMMSTAANFTVFMSYEDEKVFQAKRLMQGYTSNYKIDKVIKNISWLNLPAQIILLKGGPKDEGSEIVFTDAFDIPIGLVLDSPLRALPGTPLQFVFSERGWMTRLTATSLKLEKVSDKHFQVDPKFRVMSFEQMVQKISDFK